MTVSLVMHLYELLPSFLVYWCMLFCILSYGFVVSIKNSDVDWPLSSWGYGPAHWRRMLDGMTAGPVQLRNGPIYVPVIQMRLCWPLVGELLVHR